MPKKTTNKSEWVASVAGFTCGDIALHWSEKSLAWQLYNLSTKNGDNEHLGFDDEQLRQLHAITTAFMKAAEADE